jgi:hypothetical protein
MKKARTKILLQAQIEQAMRVTRSNRSAAEYLRVGYNLYKKFAKLYKNPSTGETLFDSHKNMEGRGISKSSAADKRRFKLDDILTGKHPQYPKEKLLKRIVAAGYREEKCQSCGYCAKRPTDFKSPLVLHHMNGETTDHRIDNLEILCYNCYFIQVGDLSRRDLKTPHIIRPMETATPSTAEMIEQGIDPTSLGEMLSEEEKIELLKSLENL